MPPKRQNNERLLANPVVEPAVGQGRMQRLNEAQLNQPMMLPLDEALRRQREAGLRRERGEEEVNPQPVNPHDPEFDRILFRLFPKYIAEVTFARVGFYYYVAPKNSPLLSFADPPIFYMFNNITHFPHRGHVATFTKKHRWEDWHECHNEMAAAADDKRQFLEFVNVKNALETRNYIRKVGATQAGFDKLAQSRDHCVAEAARISNKTLDQQFKDSFMARFRKIHTIEDLSQNAYCFTDEFYRDQALYLANHQ